MFLACHRWKKNVESTGNSNNSSKREGTTTTQPNSIALPENLDHEGAVWNFEIEMRRLKLFPLEDTTRKTIADDDGDSSVSSADENLSITSELKRLESWEDSVRSKLDEIEKWNCEEKVLNNEYDDHSIENDDYDKNYNYNDDDASSTMPSVEDTMNTDDSTTCSDDHEEFFEDDWSVCLDKQCTSGATTLTTTTIPMSISAGWQPKTRLCGASSPSSWTGKKESTNQRRIHYTMGNACLAVACALLLSRLYFFFVTTSTGMEEYKIALATMFPGFLLVAAETNFSHELNQMALAAGMILSYMAVSIMEF